MSRSTPSKSITLPNGAAAAVNSTALSQNEGVVQGDITAVKVVTPNFTNPITVTVALYDRNGIKVWVSDALSENSGAEGHVVFPADPLPLEYGEYWKVTPSGDPGGTGGAVTVVGMYCPDGFISL